jgi:NAD(P)-dependent dehydrogenase (short-subunit alcohol dehydrogenase family)
VKVLSGKVALITGAGRGIGRSIAKAYAEAGAQLAITAALTGTELQETAAQTGALGLQADVSRPADVQRVVDTVLARYGRIDILVNNAGRGMRYVNEAFMTEPGRFWECDPAVWQTIIDTNINGVFLMSRSVIPHMLRAGAGRIINIAINLETQRRKGFSPYGPSKAALDAMTEIWAEELRGTGVTVNGLLPGGATETGMIPERFPAALRGQLLSPEIMGPPAVYLASDAAAEITGQRIVARDWLPPRPGA